MGIQTEIKIIRNIDVLFRASKRYICMEIARFPLAIPRTLKLDSDKFYAVSVSTRKKITQA